MLRRPSSSISMLWQETTHREADAATMDILSCLLVDQESSTRPLKTDFGDVSLIPPSPELLLAVFVDWKV